LDPCILLLALLHDFARPIPTHHHRQFRWVLCGVRGDLDDEVGVEGGGDPVQERDGGDDAAGFEAGQGGLGHASPGGELDLGQAQGQAAVAHGAAEQEWGK